MTGPSSSRGKKETASSSLRMLSSVEVRPSTNVAVAFVPHRAMVTMMV